MCSNYLQMDAGTFINPNHRPGSNAQQDAQSRQRGPAVHLADVVAVVAFSRSYQRLPQSYRVKLPVLLLLGLETYDFSISDSTSVILRVSFFPGSVE